jgi:hypothetical protein
VGNTYTFFHVCRYMPGGAQQRIWDISANYNWISGFIESFSGVAYHQASLGACCSSGFFGGAWVLSTDQVGGGRGAPTS